LQRHWITWTFELREAPGTAMHSLSQSTILTLTFDALGTTELLVLAEATADGAIARPTATRLAMVKCAREALRRRGPIRFSPT
jgi:hypothetical protein